MTEKERNKLEKLAIQIQKECEKDGEPVSWAESLEMAEMELNSKQDCKRYETSTKERKPTNRAVKIDEQKVLIVKLLNKCLCNSFARNVIVKNEQREITFTVDENEYSITLTKHRNKKKT